MVQSAEEAMSAVRAGDFESAAAFARERLAQAPDDPDALAISGQVALRNGDLASAAAQFERALSTGGEHVGALTGLAEVRIRMNDNAPALELAKRARRAAPDALSPLFVMAPPAIALRDKVATQDCLNALDHIDDATATALMDFWTQRLSEHYRLHEAALLYKSLLDSLPADAHRLISYASILVRANSTEQARPYVERAIRLAPNDGRAHLLAANIATSAGRFEQAAASARRAVECDGRLVSAYSVIASANAKEINEDDLVALARLHDDASLNAEERAIAAMAQSAALDARGEYDAAFEAAARANAVMREWRISAGVAYDRTAMEARIEAAKAAFPTELLSRPHADPERGRGLIFIIGTPRSGSTLLDQALASHSKADSVGENGRMRRIQLAFEQARTASPEADLAALIEANAEAWDAQYRESLRSTSKSAEVVVDKLLDNCWRVGLIARLYPAARIIVSRRNPMDVGLSMFRLGLPVDYSCATDLSDIGHFCRCVEAITDYWLEALPDQVELAEYEKVIEDFEGVMTGMLQRAGLEMEPGVLAFHENQREVFTLSSVQVRQGLTSSRKDRWRRYERHLGPLKDALGLADD